MFGGVTIGTAYNLDLAEPVPIEVARPEPPPPFTVTAECRLTDADRFFADVRRLMPTAPSGVVTLSLPWGILLRRNSSSFSSRRKARGACRASAGSWSLWCSCSSASWSSER